MNNPMSPESVRLGVNDAVWWAVDVAVTMCPAVYLDMEIATENAVYESVEWAIWGGCGRCRAQTGPHGH